MKHFLFYSVIFSILLFSTACSFSNVSNSNEQDAQSSGAGPINEKSENVIVKNKSDLFHLQLESTKSVLQPHEKESISAKVKYIGPEEEITIEHGGFTPILFTVTENSRNITIDPVQPSILLSTTYKKNKWYTYEFTKTGGIGQDPFLLEYFNEDGFPKGEYTIKAEFSFEHDEKNIVVDEHTIEIGKIDISVR